MGNTDDSGTEGVLGSLGGVGAHERSPAALGPVLECSQQSSGGSVGSTGAERGVSEENATERQQGRERRTLAKKDEGLAQF